MTSCPLCQSELPSDASACPFCGTVVGPPTADGQTGQRQALKALQLAQDALQETEGRGVDLGVARSLMEKAREALARRDYRQAEEVASGVRRAALLAQRRSKLEAAIQGLRVKAQMVRELGGQEAEILEAIEQANRATRLGDFRGASTILDKATASTETYLSFARGRALLEEARGRLREAVERGIDVSPLRPFLQQAEEAQQESDLEALDKALKLIERALGFTHRKSRAEKRLVKVEDEIKEALAMGVDTSAPMELITQARRALRAGMYNDVDRLTREAQQGLQSLKGRSRLERSLARAGDRLSELEALRAETTDGRSLLEQARALLEGGNTRASQAKIRDASDVMARSADARRRRAMVEDLEAELRDLREMGADVGPVEESLAAAKKALEAEDLGALRGACEVAWRAAQAARRNRERQILLVAAEKIVDRVGSGGVSALGAKELLAEIRKHLGSGKVGDLEQILEAKFNAEVLRKEKDVLQAMAALERFTHALKDVGMDASIIEEGLRNVKDALTRRKPWEAEEELKLLEERGEVVRGALRQAAEETVGKARTGLRGLEEQGISLPEARELLSRAEVELAAKADDRAVALGRFVLGVVERARREHFEELARHEVEKLRADELARTTGGRLRVLGEVEARLKESGVATEGLRTAMEKAKEALAARRWGEVAFHLDLGEQLGRGMEESLRSMVQDIMAKAEETLGRVESEGLAVGEGREALRAARDALAAKRYDAAFRFAQQATQAVDVARHRREAQLLEKQELVTREIREKFASVGKLLEELKKAGIDISGGEENLLEASKAIQDEEFDQATEILQDMEDMGNSLRASFIDAAQEFIRRAQMAIEAAEKLKLAMPEAKEMCENAKRAYQEGHFDRAVELSKLAERKAKTSVRTAIDEADALVREKVEKAQARIRRLRKVMKDLGRADIAIEGAEEALVGADEALAQGDFDDLSSRLTPVEEMAEGLASGLRVAAQELLARTRRGVDAAKAEGLSIPRGEQVMNTAQMAWEEERYVEALEYCKVIEDIIQDVKKKRKAQEVLAGLQRLKAEASQLRALTKLPPEVEDFLLEAVEEAQSGEALRAKELGGKVAVALERARGELEASLTREADRFEYDLKEEGEAPDIVQAAREALVAGRYAEARGSVERLRSMSEERAKERARADLLGGLQALRGRLQTARGSGVEVGGLDRDLEELEGEFSGGLTDGATKRLEGLQQALSDREEEFAKAHRPDLEVEGSAQALQAGAWNRDRLLLRNRGSAQAREIKLLARGPGEFRLPASIAPLGAGEERGLEVGWRPTTAGEVKVEVQAEYRGPFAPDLLRVSSELTLQVRPSGTYLIDDLFLVHADGRLVHHASRKFREAVDEDIFSGMLTIVQDFVRDSFRQPKGVGLKRLEFGDSVILIERGPHVYLAAVLSGTEPGLLPLYMAEVIRDLEVRYGQALERWTGLMGDVAGIHVYVDALLDLTVGGPGGPLGQGTVDRALKVIRGVGELGADTSEADRLMREAQERIEVEGSTALQLVEAAMEKALRAQDELQERISRDLGDFRGALEDLRALGQDTRTMEGQVEGASEALRTGDLAAAGRMLRSLGEAMEGLKGGAVVQRVAEQVERVAMHLETLGQADPGLAPLRKELEEIRLRLTQGEFKGLGPRMEALGEAIDVRRKERRKAEVAGGLQELERSVDDLRRMGVVTQAVEATLKGARDALARGQTEEAENLVAVAQEGLKGVKAEVLRDRQPRLFVRTQGGTLEAGVWNRVMVELSNRGNWPAQGVQVQVLGEVEVQGLEDLRELGLNEVRQIEIGVKPTKEGSIPVDLEVTYGRLLDEARYAVRDARDLTVERTGTYAVEDVFLFLSDGRLVRHEGARYRGENDPEEFGRMLQALEDFLRDAFKQRRTGGLRRMEVGPNRVAVEKGPREYLAAVTNGDPPALLPLYMVEALNEIETRFGAQLAPWDGKIPEGLPPILRRLLYVTDIRGAEMGDLQDSPISAVASAAGPGSPPPALAQALAVAEKGDYSEVVSALRSATRNAVTAEDLSAEVRQRAVAAAREGFNVQVDDASLRNYIDMLKRVDRAMKKARAKANVDTALPVRKVAIRMVSEELANAVRGFASVIMKQGNAKELDVVRPGEIWRGLDLRMDINSEAIAKAYKGVWAKKIELILKSQDPWKIKSGLEKGQYNLGLEGMTIKITADMVTFTPVLPPHTTIQDFESGIIYLDTQLTPEIQGEVMAREVVRLVREARRELGLAPDEPLPVTVEGDAEVVKLLTPFRDTMSKEAKAQDLQITTQHEVQEGIAAECEALGHRFNVIIVVPQGAHRQEGGGEAPPPPAQEPGA